MKLLGNLKQYILVTVVCIVLNIHCFTNTHTQVRFCSQTPLSSRWGGGIAYKEICNLCPFNPSEGDCSSPPVLFRGISKACIAFLWLPQASAWLFQLKNISSGFPLENVALVPFGGFRWDPTWV